MLTPFTFYIWSMAFLSVFVSLFWVIVNSTIKQHGNRLVEIKDYPLVTIAIPAWNEEKSIVSTLECILNLDYPKDKMQIIVIDDNSKDDTFAVTKKFISKNKNIQLLRHNNNKGKAGAMNTALRYAKGEFFWVYDADSYASKELLKNLVCKFYEEDNEKVGAVVAITLIKNHGNWVEKMQRLEYVMTAFMRKLTGSTDTLHTTNALSLFRTKVIRSINGFDEGNLTEDFEIAMRMRSRGYRIVMCEKGNFYTKVPNKIKNMWLQRVRWFRGFIQNTLKYKKMAFNKQFGLLGLFQIPLEIFVLLTLFFSIALFGYHIFGEIINLVSMIYITGYNFFDYFILPSFNQFLLELNWRLLFPSLVVLCSALYLYIEAHRYVGEKWRFYIPSLLYLFVYPLFRSMQWIHAASLEIFGAKKKW
ncbi:glycosyltransferase family 2 protein [Candidatus Woesearchaeota archaeon]|nr:glycosyltransferase family 2 protein [Candidatus Woesearchaeota archaeon]